jgi:hypothetical protein
MKAAVDATGAGLSASQKGPDFDLAIWEYWPSIPHDFPKMGKC